MSLEDMPRNVLELIVKNLDTSGLRKLGDVNRFFCKLVDENMDIKALLYQPLLPGYSHGRSISHDYVICEHIYLEKKDVIRLRKVLKFKKVKQTEWLINYIAQEICRQALEYLIWYEKDIFLTTSDRVFEQIPWEHQQISLRLKEVCNLRAIKIHYRIEFCWGDKFIVHFSEAEIDFWMSVLDKIQVIMARSADEIRGHELTIEINRDSFEL